MRIHYLFIGIILIFNTWKINASTTSQLDSLVNIEDGKKFEKELYHYDSLGNNIEQVFLKWDSIHGKWFNAVKGVYAYDKNKNKILDATYDWDTTKLDWVGNHKYEYAFDNSGKQTLSSFLIFTNNGWQYEYIYSTTSIDTTDGIVTTQLNWNSPKYVIPAISDKRVSSIIHGNNVSGILYVMNNADSTWHFASKHVATVQDTIITSSIWCNWNSSKSTWVNQYKIDYSYNNNDSTQIESLWDSTSVRWKLYTKDEFTNDNRNNLTQHIQSIWDTTTATWVPSFKHVKTYDAHENNTFYARFQWDKTTSTWKGMYKSEMMYDNQDNKISLIGSTFNNYTGKWFTTEKYEYAYDSNGKQTLNALYTANYDDSTWIGYWKHKFIYDSKGNETNENYYYWNTTTSAWDISYTHTNTYDSLNNKTIDIFNDVQSKYTGTTYYYYSYKADTTSIRANITLDGDSKELLIYPNPAKTDFMVKTDGEATIQIYSMSGELVSSRKIYNNEMISTNDLSTGIYLIKIITSNSIITHKLIIKNN